MIASLCYTNQTCGAIEGLHLEVLTVSFFFMQFVSAIAYVQGQCEGLISSMVTEEYDREAQDIGITGDGTVMFGSITMSFFFFFKKEDHVI